MQYTNKELVKKFGRTWNNMFPESKEKYYWTGKEWYMDMANDFLYEIQSSLYVTDLTYKNELIWELIDANYIGVM